MQHRPPPRPSLQEIPTGKAGEGRGGAGALPPALPSLSATGRGGAPGLLGTQSLPPEEPRLGKRSQIFLRPLVSAFTTNISALVTATDFFKKFIYLFRASAQAYTHEGGGAERKEESASITSRLRAVRAEPDAGLGRTTCEIRTSAEESRPPPCLSHPDAHAGNFLGPTTDFTGERPRLTSHPGAGKKGPQSGFEGTMKQSDVALGSHPIKPSSRNEKITSQIEREKERLHGAWRAWPAVTNPPRRARVRAHRGSCRRDDPLTAPAPRASSARARSHARKYSVKPSALEREKARLRTRGRGREAAGPLRGNYR